MSLFKKYRKAILNVVFLVVVFGLTMWSVFGTQDQNLSQVVEYLRDDFNMAYLIPCILCVLVFILGESVIINFLLAALGTKVKLSHCFLYSFIGFFYSAITPSASGGQPMQLLAMRKDKIPSAVSTVVLAIVTITYKMVLVVLGAVVLIVRPEPVMACLGNALWVIYLGMFLNVVFIALLLVLVFHPSLILNAGVGGLKVINRIKPLKDFQGAQAKIEKFASQYKGTAEFFLSNLRLILIVFGLTFVQRWALFVVTWFTYKAFGLAGDGFWLVTTLQGMVSVAVDMLPLPGGMGVSENLFLVVFKSVFGPAMTLPGMVVSRGISYYVQVLICAVMTIVSAFILKDQRKK